MKTLIYAISFICAFLISQNCVAQSASVKGSNNGVTMEVFFQLSYPKSSELNITHKITNISGEKIKTIRATDIYDLSIRLTDPRGNIVKPYFRDDGQHKRFLTSYLRVGESQTDSLNLAEYFPITQSGKYKCLFSRQIYDVLNVKDADVTRNQPGKPIEIVAPEFEFEVIAFDSAYKSPLADAVAAPDVAAPTKLLTPSVNGNQSETKLIANQSRPENEISSMAVWSIIAVLIMVALGLIWWLPKWRNKSGEDN